MNESFFLSLDRKNRLETFSKLGLNDHYEPKELFTEKKESRTSVTFFSPKNHHQKATKTTNLFRLVSIFTCAVVVTLSVSQLGRGLLVGWLVRWLVGQAHSSSFDTPRLSRPLENQTSRNRQRKERKGIEIQ